MCRFKRLFIAAFQFDSEGKIVDLLPAAKIRYAGVPCPHLERDKLKQFAAAPDQEMRGYFHFPYFGKIRVRINIEAVGEKLLDEITAVTAGRQADGVDYQHFDCR